MTNDPLLTIEQLAAILRIADDMARQWQADGILPVEADADGETKYRQRAVVHELRKYPDVMSAVRDAMSARAQRGDSS